MKILKNNNLSDPKISVIESSSKLENFNEEKDKISEESEIEDNSNLLSKPKEDIRNRVSIIDIPKTAKTEFKLILQNQKIPFSKMGKIFPNTKRVHLAQLIEHFKKFDRFESDETIEKVCRYLVENEEVGDLIPYDENADIDMIAI